jgi:hypothetical protein
MSQGQGLAWPWTFKSQYQFNTLTEFLLAVLVVGQRPKRNMLALALLYVVSIISD